MEDLELREIFEIFLKKKFLIILFIILGAIVGAIYSYNFVTPKYKASTRIILSQISDVEEDKEEVVTSNKNNKTSDKNIINSTITNTTGINANDITLNQKLVSTYSEIIRGDSVLSEVIEQLNITDSQQSLRNNISVTSVSDTQIIEITVANEDAVKAKNIANKIPSVFEKKIEEVYHISNFSILEEAKVNNTPYNINHIRDIAIFSLIGLVTSIALILFLNMIDNTVGSEKEIENNLNTNVLVSIPECEKTLKNGNRKGKRYIQNEIITFSTPKSQISEIFRTLRTNIQFMSSSKNIKTLLITSTMPGEGKSWITANLANTFTQSNKKVLIIDTDMRKGRQSSLFNITNEPGLSNYLSGLYLNGNAFSDDIEECIYCTEIKGLYLIPAGTITANSSELLASEKMYLLLQELKNKFDLIILDGTPSCIVTDSIILSKDADATLLVSAYKKTKLEDLKRISKEIKNVEGKMIGVVLNRVKQVKKRYKNYYYYGS